MPDPGGADRRQRVATATGICRAACVKKSATKACQPPGARLLFRSSATWGHSSAGRAPAWHAGGQRFDPAWLHHFDIRPSKVLQLEVFRASPSSRGLGHHPFTVATGVRIPVGTPLITNNEDPADNRVFFVHRLPAFRLWRCGSPALVASVEPERKKLKKGFHKREHAGMIGGSVTRGHSSAGRAPAWHAGGQRFDPAWLHHFDIRPSKVLQLEVFRASPSSRGLGHHPFTVATGVRIPVGTPVSNGLCSRQIIRGFIGAIAQLGERLHGMQEVSGSIPLGSTTSTLGRRRFYNLKFFVRPHRLEA